MKLHLCCNQKLMRWEVRNDREEVLFSGTLEQCKARMEIVGQ